MASACCLTSCSSKGDGADDEPTNTEQGEQNKYKGAPAGKNLNDVCKVKSIKSLYDDEEYEEYVFEYDEHNRVTKIYDGEEIHFYQYSEDKILLLQDRGQEGTCQFILTDGLITEMIDSDGLKTTYTYDKEGYLVKAQKNYSYLTGNDLFDRTIDIVFEWEDGDIKQIKQHYVSDHGGEWQYVIDSASTWGYSDVINLNPISNHYSNLNGRGEVAWLNEDFKYSGIIDIILSTQGYMGNTRNKHLPILQSYSYNSYQNQPGYEHTWQGSYKDECSYETDDKGRVVSFAQSNYKTLITWY